MATGDDMAGLTFEQALAELDTLIGRLEGGQVDLADAVGLYERGSGLARHCAELLDSTEAQVTQLVVSGNGIAEKPLATAADTVVASAPVALPRAAPVSGAGARPSAGGERGLFPAVEPLSAAGPDDVDPDDIPF